MSPSDILYFKKMGDRPQGFLWSPVVGCSGDGCKCAGSHCWAGAVHGMRHRAHCEGKKVPQQYAKPFGEVQCIESRLDEPLRRKKPTVIGACFTGDLFDAQVPYEFVDEVFATMTIAEHHTYVLTTKQVARMRNYLETPGWGCPPAHVYLGVSVCDQEDADERIPHLIALAAQGWHIWVSWEPALGNVDFTPWLWRCECGAAVNPVDGAWRFDGAHWQHHHGYPIGHVYARVPTNGIGGIVMGCESGPGRRLPKCETCGGDGCADATIGGRVHFGSAICRACAGTGYAAWGQAARLAEQCRLAEVPYYCKQLPDADGRVVTHPHLDGRQWLELPWSKP